MCNFENGWQSSHIRHTLQKLINYPNEWNKVHKYILLPELEDIL